MTPARLARAREIRDAGRRDDVFYPGSFIADLVDLLDKAHAAIAIRDTALDAMGVELRRIAARRTDVQDALDDVTSYLAGMRAGIVRVDTASLDAAKRDAPHCPCGGRCHHDVAPCSLDCRAALETDASETIERLYAANYRLLGVLRYIEKQAFAMGNLASAIEGVANAAAAPSGEAGSSHPGGTL